MILGAVAAHSPEAWQKLKSMSPMLRKNQYNSLFNMTVKEQLKGVDKCNKKIEDFVEKVYEIDAKRAEMTNFVTDALEMGLTIEYDEKKTGN